MVRGSRAWTRLQRGPSQGVAKTLAPDATGCSGVCARGDPASGSPHDHAARVASGADEHRDPIADHEPSGVPGLSQPWRPCCPKLRGRPFLRPVAQKQSTRLISGRRRSVTSRDEGEGSWCKSTREHHSQDCGVTRSISPCEGDGPGANPGFLTIPTQLGRSSQVIAANERGGCSP